jgi:hypothetical protein
MKQEIRLNFICTHIQGEVIYRRSGQTAATHFHVKRCFAIQAAQSYGIILWQPKHWNKQDSRCALSEGKTPSTV